jgi:hypothetical protein
MSADLNVTAVVGTCGQVAGRVVVNKISGLFRDGDKSRTR